MESKNILGLSVLGLTCLLGAQSAVAQVAIQPQSVPFGSFVLTPTLNMKTVSDDNIYSSAAEEVSSFSQIVNPNLAFSAQDRLNVYKAVYNLNGASFANDSNDSYADHTMDLSAHLEPSARFRLDAGLAYKMLHDDRGTTASGKKLVEIRKIGEVDKYDVSGVRGGFEYGAKTAKGLIVFTADMTQKRYSRDTSAKGKDSDTLTTMLGLRAKVWPMTTFLVDYEYTDTNYKTAVANGGTADAKDDRILAGVSWEATAQTTGKLRVGNAVRKVDGSPEVSKLTWDLGVQWKPVQLDTIGVNASDRTSDGTDPFSSVHATSYSISWTHDWLDRLNSTVSLGDNKSDYTLKPKAVAKARTDDAKTYGVTVNYQMRRWLVLNAGVNVSDNGSSDAAFATKRNVMSVGAQISL